MQNNQSDNAFSYNKLPAQGYSNTLHDVAAIDPYQIAAQQRLMPRELKSGSQRGEMVIQGKLTVVNPDTNERMVLGSNGDSFGLFAAEAVGGDDSNLDTALAITGKSLDMYKLDDEGRNTLRLGLLPDGMYNLVAVKDGYEVEDVF